MKTYSGYTEKTPKNLLLDAGAFLKNYDLEKDTFEDAVAAGKLLGATQGGGEFSAVPVVRQIEIDGVKGRAKGLESIDAWEVYIKANVLEVTEETIKVALCASVEGGSNAKYTTIKGKNYISLDDYIENITWVGTLSGSDEPVILQVFNAINTDGLKITTQDKKESIVATTFYGHYDTEKLDEPPFAIHYPKAEKTTTQEVNET